MKEVKGRVVKRTVRRGRVPARATARGRRMVEGEGEGEGEVEEEEGWSEGCWLEGWW